MDKQQRKEILNRWKHAERADLLAGMPITPEQLHRLLNYLDASLKSCDHTTKLTATFLRVLNVEEQTVLHWLGEHGGYCDCEVLANLDDLDVSLQTEPFVRRSTTKPKQKRMPRDLRTVTGWNLSRLPAP